MPVQTGPPLPAAFPSFMSVFGGGPGLEDNVRDARPADGVENGRPGAFTFMNTQSSRTDLLHPAAYEHRESVASTYSNSADSSPTTTISNFDSPSATDPSPSSSPESPNTLLPLSPFKAMMNSSIGSAVRSTPLSNLPRPVSPGNRPRNVKQLSLTMVPVMATRPSTSPSIGSPHPFSAPTSPLRCPLKTARRKPTNLTIRTPGFESSFVRTTSNIVPPTPSDIPSLRHVESSPTLPSIMSPSIQRANGMSLPPPPPKNRIASRPDSRSDIADSSESSKVLPGVREEDSHYEPPMSQEVQERGYTAGPVKVYDEGVYLYLEPTLEEASRFDTVINCAKEIKCPFTTPHTESQKSVMSVWRNDGDLSDIAEPQTAVSQISFKSAFEWPQHSGSCSPTTPRPDVLKARRPEYIHVPWDHNSETVEDLYPLCQLIDSRIADGKTVLVHCQLGVSRSASLIIAYGLFKRYQNTFPLMYNVVKERSQWISPNMSLIYQIMDFRAKVENGKFDVKAKVASPEWFLLDGSSESTATPRQYPASLPPPPPPKPQMVSSFTQTELEDVRDRQIPNFSKPLPPQPIFLQDQMSQSISHASKSATNIPSIAELVSPTATTSLPIALKSSKRSAPSIEISDVLPHVQKEARWPVLPGLGLNRPVVEMDLVMQDVPATPSLFSPRATEFMATPFGRTSAGDLAVDSPPGMPNIARRIGMVDKMQGSPAAFDPRSPPQKSEAGEIMRSIDDVL